MKLTHENPAGSTAGTLRKRAEARMAAVTRASVAAMTPDEVQTLFHELRAHQEELEIQNEELIQANAQLAETRDRYANVFEFAPTGYLTVDLDDEILESNLAATTLLHVERANLLGTKLYHFVAPDSQDAYFLLRQDAFAASAKLSPELVMQREAGTHLHIRLKSTPIHDSGGTIVQCRMVMVDITALKQSEAQLESVNATLKEHVLELKARSKELEDAQDRLLRQEKLATLGQLSVGVAHEIRNPLGIIRSRVYYLDQTMPDKDEDTQDTFSEIQRGISDAGSIIDELLQYAQDSDVDKTEFTVSELLQDVLRDLVVPPGCDVCLPEEEESQAVCRADRGQNGRIVGNLMMNAFQAMPEGRIVTVQCSHSEGLIAIALSDTGTGITADDLPHVFDPLFSRRANGFGLGLSLSQRYASLNLGHLAVESVPGQGSTFTLTLPVSDA